MKIETYQEGAIQEEINEAIAKATKDILMRDTNKKNRKITLELVLKPKSTHVEMKYKVKEVFPPDEKEGVLFHSGSSLEEEVNEETASDSEITKINDYRQAGNQ